MISAEYLGTSSDNDVAFLVGADISQHFIIAFSMDGYFDMIAKVRLHEKPTAFDKNDRDDYIMIGGRSSLYIYKYEQEQFVRIHTMNLGSFMVRQIAMAGEGLIYLLHDNQKELMLLEAPEEQ